jgi:hypothetical protein
MILQTLKPLFPILAASFHQTRPVSARDLKDFFNRYKFRLFFTALLPKLVVHQIVGSSSHRPNILRLSHFATTRTR